MELVALDLAPNLCSHRGGMLTLVVAHRQPASSNHSAFCNEKHLSTAGRSWPNAFRSSELRF